MGDCQSVSIVRLIFFFSFFFPSLLACGRDPERFAALPSALFLRPVHALFPPRAWIPRSAKLLLNELFQDHFGKSDTRTANTACELYRSTTQCVLGEWFQAPPAISVLDCVLVCCVRCCCFPPSRPGGWARATAHTFHLCA